jgi:hypothetical protein
MTRSRILTGLVVVLIALLGVYIARNSYWVTQTVTTPPKGEALINPFYAAQKFSEQLGAKTEWRRGLGGLPPTSGVVVLSGWHWDLIAQRRDRLKQWVANGGRLIIDSSLISADDDLDEWSGMSLDLIEHPRKKDDAKKTDDEQSDEYEEIEAEIFDKPILLKDKLCHRAIVKSERASDRLGRSFYMICTVEVDERITSQRPPVWSVVDPDGQYAARVPIGKGSVTLVSGRPFQYQNLFDGEHALLFAAAAQYRKGDSIYFLSDDEFDSLLTLMWRYGAPVIVLAFALVALVLWRGSARFGPLSAAPEAARRSLGEQILGTGWFTVRYGGGAALRTAAVRALFETARRRIVRFDALPAEERVNVLARASRTDPAALAEAINFSGPRRPGDLRDTLALLETARRNILLRSVEGLLA